MIYELSWPTSEGESYDLRPGRDKTAGTKTTQSHMACGGGGAVTAEVQTQRLSVSLSDSVRLCVKDLRGFLHHTDRCVCGLVWVFTGTRTHTRARFCVSACVRER